MAAPVGGMLPGEDDEEEERRRAEDNRSMAAGDGLLDSIGLIGVLHGCIPRGLCGLEKVNDYYKSWRIPGGPLKIAHSALFL